MKKMAQGFTLIDLMIVVAIIAIISAVAYPSYQDHVRKVNRADALNTLAETAQRLERCFTSYGSYTHANCPIKNAQVITSPKSHYVINVGIPSAAVYNLTAVADSAQQKNDTNCQKIMLSQTGAKTAEDASGGASTHCW